MLFEVRWITYMTIGLRLIARIESGVLAQLRDGAVTEKCREKAEPESDREEMAISTPRLMVSWFRGACGGKNERPVAS